MLLLDGHVGHKPIPFDALAPLFQRHGDCYGHLIFDLEDNYCPKINLSLALRDKTEEFLSNTPSCRFLSSIHEIHMRSWPSNHEQDQSKATSLVCLVSMEVLLQ